MKTEGLYSIKARNELAIIQRTTSNPKDWFERFFFVKIDEESV